MFTLSLTECISSISAYQASRSRDTCIFVVDAQPKGHAVVIPSRSMYAPQTAEHFRSCSQASVAFHISRAAVEHVERRHHCSDWLGRQRELFTKAILAGAGLQDVTWLANPLQCQLHSHPIGTHSARKQSLGIQTSRAPQGEASLGPPETQARRSRLKKGPVEDYFRQLLGGGIWPISPLYGQSLM